jgi:hypothetical protein
MPRMRRRARHVIWRADPARAAPTSAPSAARPPGTRGGRRYPTSTIGADPESSSSPNVAALQPSNDRLQCLAPFGPSSGCSPVRPYPRSAANTCRKTPNARAVWPSSAGSWPIPIHPSHPQARARARPWPMLKMGRTSQRAVDLPRLHHPVQPTRAPPSGPPQASRRRGTKRLTSGGFRPRPARIGRTCGRPSVLARTHLFRVPVRIAAPPDLRPLDLADRPQRIEPSPLGTPPNSGTVAYPLSKPSAPRWKIKQNVGKPHPVHPLSWLAWIIARLGGWNCNYKPPCPKTIRVGWEEFEAMAAGFAIAATPASVWLRVSK